MSNIVKIKRKIEDEPLTSFGTIDVSKLILISLVAEPPLKRATLEQKFEINLNINETIKDVKEKKTQDRKLFRLAYTITDVDKIRDFNREIHKVCK